MAEKLMTFTVPCYNSEDYMSRCIDSLLVAGNRAEILIVNDGSTDRTGEIAAWYEAHYPDICRVLTQENGGHGAGINHGIREARGTYFKVVDSDDWLDADALIQTMELLEQLNSEGGVDLLVTNYVYDNIKPELNHVIKYKNVFSEEKVLHWSDTRHFMLWQYLSMHSSAFRTQLLKDCDIRLPEHTFYEDNLFSFLPLKNVNRLAYMDVDLYHYRIGREGQSVSENILKERCEHQIFVSTLMFRAFHSEELETKDSHLSRYLYHALVFFIILAIVFTRLNDTKEADQIVRKMWINLTEIDSSLARRLRFRSLAVFVNFPGKAGRKIAILGYRMSHKYVAFN